MEKSREEVVPSRPSSALCLVCSEQLCLARIAEVVLHACIFGAREQPLVRESLLQ